MNENIEILAICSFIAALIFSFKLKFQFKKDVFKRLEENCTHKQMRELERKILKEKSERTKKMNGIISFISYLKLGPLYDARQHLNPKDLPESLLIFRRIVPLIDIAAISALGIGIKFRKLQLTATSAFISAFIIAIYVIYRKIENHNSKKTLPKMYSREKKKNFFPWNGCNPATKRKYNKNEKGIVKKAYFLRYGEILILPCICPDEIISEVPFFSGIAFIIFGVFFQYHYKCNTEVFYCAMQSFFHSAMTPYSRSEQQKKAAEKEGRWLGSMLIIIGALLLAVPFIYTLFNKK